MRPIIALSPILKLVESRFRDKLENYMTKQIMQSQAPKRAIYITDLFCTPTLMLLHANDIYDIIQKKEIEPKILALFSDNGRDLN